MTLTKGCNVAHSSASKALPGTGIVAFTPCEQNKVPWYEHSFANITMSALGASIEAALSLRVHTLITKAMTTRLKCNLGLKTEKSRLWQKKKKKD